MMKTNNHTVKYSTRTRIISAFMAFLIFSLAYAQMFDGFDFGITVSAATTTTTTGGYRVKAELWDYRYDTEANPDYHYNEHEDSGNHNDWHKYYNKWVRIIGGVRDFQWLSVPYQELNEYLSKYYNNNSRIITGLYFGNFAGTDLYATPRQYYMDNGLNISDMGVTYAYNTGNKQYYYDQYNKFHLSANLGPNTSAATRGLVDKKLNNGKITSGGIRLPMFLDDAIIYGGTYNREIIRKYDVTSNYKDNGFPFDIKTTTDSDGYKKYEYAYDSSVGLEGGHTNNNRYYNGTSFQVTTGPGTKNSSDNNGGGFFPFNNQQIDYNATVAYDSINNADYAVKKDINYGFGMRLEIPFNVSENGMQTLEKDDGSVKLSTSDSMRFDFTGDDDIWVFIDDYLILDMGGDHGAVKGYIDFSKNAANQVHIDKYVDYNDNYDKKQKNKDSSANQYNATLKSTFENAASAAGESSYSFNESEFYNPNTTHTMVIYYMERGMFESNFKATFSFAAIDPTKTNTLTLNKELKGANADSHKDDPYTYQVTLTKGDTDLDTNTIKYKSGNDSESAISGLSLRTSGDSISFDVSVSESSPVVISGIPQGTTYSVTETDPNDGSTRSPTTAQTGTIGATPSSVTVTNTYPTIENKIVLTKVDSDTDKAITTSQAKFYLLKLNSGVDATNTTAVAAFKNATSVDGVVPTYAAKVIDTELTTDNGKITVSSTELVSPFEADAKYFFFETAAPAGYEIDNSLTADKIITFTADDLSTGTDKKVSYPNKTSDGVTLTKTDKATGKAIKSSKATYYLLKLKNDPTTLNGIESAFKAAKSHIELKNTYVIDAHGPYQTNDSGVITITDKLDNGYYFFFEEQAPYGYAVDNSLTYAGANGEVVKKYFQITDDNKSYDLIYPDPINSIGLTIHKTNPDGEGLAGGIFDLYFQEKTYDYPPTFSFNSPVTSPLPAPTTKLNSKSFDTPEPAPGKTETTYTYKYENKYEDEKVPSSTESDWILPRSDNDYIYFRDFNSGTINSNDPDAFYVDKNGTGNDTHGNYKPAQGRHWINTWFAGNVFGQNEEIGYDHRYKIKAQFWKSNGSGVDDSSYVQYEVWERFIDTIKFGSNDKYQTVVWKIQPPDGYTYVRFCLYDGDNCIRTTEQFQYVLGNIYTKIGQGDGAGNAWNYPVKGEHWSTNWNGTGDTANGVGTNSNDDGRMDYTIYNTSPNTAETGSQTAPKQTARYEATDQKVIFHCNSKNVWHNIHIEFFSDSSGATSVGQGFPGYMMEPYAYAGDDYRLHGYLTYELTIPEGATHFRINNGVKSGDYAYETVITPLNTADSYKNYKNYKNYFKIKNGPIQVKSGESVELTQWSDSEITNAGDWLYENYTSNEVDSDYDYIYFKDTKGWNKVYAYFYAGGDLRSDNWQRAVYSIWPGLAPVATEYTVTPNGATGVSGEDVHSNIYDYTTNNPETTFTKDGATIYKFKIPKGDLKNYTKVIFNSGLNSGDNVTGQIMYRAGYLYSPNNTNGTMYYDNATTNYTGRGDYLYVIADDTYDNLHVKFYNAYGTQILQSGVGYVMKYAGKTSDDKNYFRIPIPADNTTVAKFSVNNGKDSNLSTGLYDIYKKVGSTYEDQQPLDYTKENMVYTLSGNTNTLSLNSPTLTTTVTTEENTSGSAKQDSKVDYTTRGDTLYIRNTAGWNMSAGTVTIQFFDSNNQQIKAFSDGATNGNGTYIMIETVAETADQAVANKSNGAGSVAKTKWYTIDIPVNATQFKITYDNNKTATGKIYERRTDGLDEKWTPEHMYYETSNNSLKLLYPTFTKTIDYNGTDKFNNLRGDNLYLVVGQNSLSDWDNMRVTFYNSDGTAIPNKSNDTSIVPNYLGELKSSNVPVDSISTNIEDAVGHWFKVAIPQDAASFKVTSPLRNSQTGEIYRLSEKVYHFRKDYTPGDMQYRITDTLNAGEYNLSCIYPVFTEDSFYTMPDNEDINSSIPVPGKGGIDDSAVSGYNTVAPPTIPTVESTAPVLYPTPTNTITYSWGDGDSDKYIYFDNSGKNWSEIQAYFFNGHSGNDTNIVYQTWTGISMTPVETGSNIYKAEIPTTKSSSNNTSCTFYSVIFNGKNSSNDVEQTSDLDLSAQNFGKGKIYKPESSSTDPWEKKNRIYFIVPKGQYSDMNNEAWNSAKMKLRKSNGSGGYTESAEISLGTQVGSGYLRNETTQTTINADVYKYDISPSDNWTEVKFYDGGNDWTHDDTTYKRGYTDWQSLTDYGVGNYFYWTNGTYHTGTGATAVSMQIVEEYDNSTKYSFADYDGDDGSNLATYQPEDRYGYIEDVTSLTGDNNGNGTDTTMDNFLKLNIGGVTNPYVRFYTDESGTSEVNYGTTLTNGISLKYNKINSTAIPAQSSPYVIRIPKGAKSFKINDGNGHTTDAIELYQNGKANVFSTTLFNGSFSNPVTSTTRTTHTAGIQNMLKTDDDYIFLKGDYDHAYYYGGADGEFCPWPGVEASYSYQDNDGQTIYAFQIPTESGSHEKVYPYVIFTNGQNDGSGMTQAIPYTGGTIYTPGSNGVSYGGSDWSSSAKEVSSKSKTNSNVDGTATSSYIYMVDNGTKNLNDNGRYVLDDMHIKFFADESETNPIGNQNGYVMDRLTANYIPNGNDTVAPDNGSGTVYRISVPDGANYFQITNGGGKTGTTNDNERQSEVKKVQVNGLYRFVAKADNNTDYIQEDNYTTLSTPHYLLDLINETKQSSEPEEEEPDIPAEYNDIHLATIVTDENGMQDYIKWLKMKDNQQDEVDDEYLDHTADDIGENVHTKEVRVKKLGTYYWVETKAPEGYKVSDEKIEFKVTEDYAAMGTFVTELVDYPLNGKVLLIKTAKEKVGNTDIGDGLIGAEFQLTTKEDTNIALSVVKKKNTSEYYLLPAVSSKTYKKEYIALAKSGEYETDGTITITIGKENVPKLKEYTTDLTTDENGYIKIENLPWGNYTLTETKAPINYVNTTGSEANTISFSVGKNNSDTTQQLTISNEMEPSYIKLFEHINEWRHTEWGDPTFVFKIKQTQQYELVKDESGNWNRVLKNVEDSTERIVSLTVNDDGTVGSVLLNSVTGTDFSSWYVESTDEMQDYKREYQGMYHIDSEGRIRVEPGTYEITRVPISRYEFVTSATTAQYDNGNNSPTDQNENQKDSTPLEKVTITELQAGKTIDVHYYDKVGYYDKFSQVDTKVNKFYQLNTDKENITLKGIRVENYFVSVADHLNNAADATINVSGNGAFQAYLIYADGSEETMVNEKTNLTISYDSTDDTTDTFKNDFEYNSDNQITVKDYKNYKDSVYTLKASYTDSGNTFTTTFDLIFEHGNSNVTYYTGQVIFKNDDKDPSNKDYLETNISYFEDSSGNHTHAYGYTFVIAKDNSTNIATVEDIRHNGVSIKSGNQTAAAAWTSELNALNSKLKILDKFNYTFDSWTSLSGVNTDSISNHFTSQTLAEGSTEYPDPVEFAAHLKYTSSS